MTFGNRLSSWVLIVSAAVLLAMGWISTALAEVDGDTDGFDGDELGLPILLGIGVLAALAWRAIQSRSSKSRN